MDYDSLVAIQSTIANDMQLGVLGDAIDLTVASLAMVDPLPTPVDPTGGVRASNETEQAENGTRYVFLEWEQFDSRAMSSITIKAAIALPCKLNDKLIAALL